MKAFIILINNYNAKKQQYCAKKSVFKKVGCS